MVMFSFDNVIENIVGNGRFQLFSILLIGCISIPNSQILSASVFIGGMPDSRCRIEPFDNSTAYPNITSDDITKLFIPINDLTKKPDRCIRYIYNTSCQDSLDETCLFGVNNSKSLTTTKCDVGYVYDRSSYQETIVTEWDLVCDKMTISFASASLFYFGLFFASFMGGILCDKFGRIFIFRGSVIIALLIGVSIAFSPNIYVYSALRFLMGLDVMAIVVSAFVFMIEISRNKWRTTIGLLFNAIFGLGSMIFSLLALTWRDWRHLQIAKSVIGLTPFIVLSWCYPESPRWLFAGGQRKKSKKICESMAKRNNTQLSEDIWQKAEENFMKPENAKEKQFALKELFIRPCTRFLILSNMFVWMITSMVYYGLMLNAGSLPGSVYFNNMMGGLMELLACTSAIFIVTKVGFTKTTSCSLYVASLACLSSTLCIQFGNGNSVIDTLGAVLSMIGRFGSSMAFGVIFVHTVEMFPTVGRATALGLSSMAARIGSTFSPFTVQIQLTIPWLTPTIFGILAFFAASLSLNFPETKGKKLLMSFDDAERSFSKHFYRKFITRLVCLPTNNDTKTEDSKNEESLLKRVEI